MVEGFLFAPFAVGIGMLAVIGIALTVYVLFDMLFRQDEMDAVEKLVWVVIVLSFNVLGVIAYLIVVMHQDTYLFDSALLGGNRRQLDELEKLQELHEDGALTDAEFEREKQKILDAE